MENISNKISPIFNRIFNNQLLDRLLGTEESNETQPTINPTMDSSSTNTQQSLNKIHNSTLNTNFSQTKLPSMHLQSRYLHGRQLGKLNPSLYLNEETEDLYEIPPGHIGRVWFSLVYCKTMELLKVTIHKARNLRPISTSTNTLENTFIKGQNSVTNQDDHITNEFRIKLFIEQSERKYHMTSIRKQTINPDFNEQFCFQIAPHSLNQQILHLNLLGIDKRHRCILIGQISYSLDNLDEEKDEKKITRIYRDLQLDSDKNASCNPQLVVALTYFPQAERLIVGLFECKNLPLRENGLPIDVFAKIVIYQGLHGKELKTKRTEALGLKESFNESFVFQKISDPSNVNVRITLVQHGFIDKQIGFVVLGNEMVSKGRGVDHWKTMIEKPEEQICEWQELWLL